ncbi:hypothetical protein MPSEU_000906900 [Mayamaea pseudoterrestris]|nr:hypothetical protein MPSEU_000906900 [Mayamaea pseudoterrestris]
MLLFFSLLWVALAMRSASAFVTPSDPQTKPVLHRPVVTIAKADRGKGHNVNKPPVLDGTYPGDYGFDPLGFVRTKDDLEWYREAEIKHARLAMLAAVGWPLSELLDRPIGNYFGVRPAVDAAERAPSVLNGGLDKVLPGYWVFFFLLGAFVEYQYYIAKEKPGYFPGNLDFDPLRLYPDDKAGQRRRQLAEIRNGRLAMLAVVTYALEEWIYKLAVVELTPGFFKPAWVWLDHGGVQGVDTMVQ